MQYWKSKAEILDSIFKSDSISFTDIKKQPVREIIQLFLILRKQLRFVLQNCLAIERNSSIEIEVDYLPLRRQLTLIILSCFID